MAPNSNWLNGPKESHTVWDWDWRDYIITAVLVAILGATFLARAPW